MGLWSRLFGRAAVPAPAAARPPTARPALRAMPDFATLTRPAVQLLTADDGATLSHFGGVPRLPEGVDWPRRDGAALGFLARLSLPELHRAHRVDWLPATGALLFFFDMDGDRWGFDPSDRGSFAVLHVPDLPAPPGPADGQTTLPQRAITCRRIEVLPSMQRGHFQGVDVHDDEADRYFETCEAIFADRPKHQVSGYPSPVQGDDMELTCQLVTHGLYCGDARGYKDPRAASLKAGAADWRLLLQIDTDDALDLMWGDCGTLYFWVEERKARAGDFVDAWVQMQCC